MESLVGVCQAREWQRWLANRSSRERQKQPPFAKATAGNLRVQIGSPTEARSRVRRAKVGAGNGIRTRDFDLGKVALYH